MKTSWSLAGVLGLARTSLELDGTTAEHICVFTAETDLLAQETEAQRVEFEKFL